MGDCESSLMSSSSPSQPPSSDPSLMPSSSPSQPPSSDPSLMSSDKPSYKPSLMTSSSPSQPPSFDPSLMRRVFYNTDIFQINLCEWGNKVDLDDDDLNTFQMFKFADRCPNTNDPSPDNWCFDCN